MSPVYTDEIKMLVFDDICFHAGHHQNKQQNNSQRQQEDLQQLWIDIPTGKSLGVAKNPAEAWEFKWPGNCSSSECKCVLGLPEVNCRPVPDLRTAITPTGHCHKCVESIVSTKTYKKDREKLNNKMTSVMFVWVSFVKSTNTSSNSLVKIVSKNLEFYFVFWINS